jgi:hypothetical protein
MWRLRFELASLPSFLLLLATPLVNIVQSRKKKPDGPQRQDENEELVIG